ncbi:hypothetical protein A4A49_52681 [Nicotiana attenuata]|uniref:CCHC-type domain-containing protein n=1 Tax=Nicotiana attenuata TaxID=49451 RepID=A0A314KVA8_NICAT|nr:hypothetical protein A4A49_52681 [Nicotiana attenuata]
MDATTILSGVPSLANLNFEIFDGKDVPRWRGKMEFSTAFEVATNEATSIREQILKWQGDDYLCKNYILGAMTNKYYDQYFVKCKSAKELWDAHQAIYLAEEASSKKFLVSNYMEFKMIDDKSITDQSSECYHCHKIGHYARDCKILKAEKKKEKVNNNRNDEFVAMVTEEFVAENQVEWWIDTVGDDKVMYMENSSSAKVVEKGTVELNFTSEKMVTLKEVLHVPDIRKNLMDCLSRNGKRCFIAFIDDYARYTYVFPLRTKD